MEYVMVMSKQDRNTLDFGDELKPIRISKTGKLCKWSVAGQEVKSGSMLELCMSSNPEYDDDGEVFSFAHVWILIRIEFDFRGLPIAFWPVPYAEDLVSTRIPARARLRWPAPGGHGDYGHLACQVALPRKPDPLGEALNSGDGTYKP